MYIYDPITGEIKANYTVEGVEVATGSPFVGCIDGDGIPEILVGQDQSGTVNIHAYNVNLSLPADQAITPK